MFKVEKIFHFEAGHQLHHHDGKCCHPHGHSYTLVVTLQGKSLQKEGPKKNMVQDFSDISAVVKPMITEFLDHHWLNDTLETDSPTAEVIAEWIYHYLKPKLPLLASITIYETASSKVTFAP